MNFCCYWNRGCMISGCRRNQSLLYSKLIVPNVTSNSLCLTNTTAGQIIETLVIIHWSGCRVTRFRQLLLPWIRPALLRFVNDFSSWFVQLGYRYFDYFTSPTIAPIDFPLTNAKSKFNSETIIQLFRVYKSLRQFCFPFAEVKEEKIAKWDYQKTSCFFFLRCSSARRVQEPF